MKTAAALLDELTVKGTLVESLPDGAVRCLACAHRCKITEGKRGMCQVRFNHGGELHVPWGYVAGAAIDPIEKKPFAHFLPGSDALTFGMLGCNLRCDFCQNWFSSQTLRDPEAEGGVDSIQKVQPDKLVQHAVRGGAAVIASSYNEPLITSEWAFDIFALAVREGIKCVYVSNGFASPEVLDHLKPVLSGFKVDLKTMQEKQYKVLGARLQPVLDSIVKARSLGFWVEVVTLVIPGFNDDSAELWDAARFIASTSADIPWHVTAYHPQYRHEAPPTSVEILQRAADIGQEAGLRYVYAGNLPGRVGSLEDTFCPQCTQLLVKRRGYTVYAYHITKEGKCPKCNSHIAGVWTDQPENVRIGGFGMPRWV